jgi:tetratricopeptide (TPR) repeat protein
MKYPKAMYYIRFKLLLVAGLFGLLATASAVAEVGISNALSIAEDIIIEAIDVNPEEASQLIDSLVVLETDDPDFIRGLMAYYKGELSYSLGQWSEAGNHYQNSIDIFLAIDDSVKLAAAYNNLGLVQSFQGNYDNSLEAYTRSLDYEMAIGNAIGIAQCYQNIAIVFAAGNQQNKALEFYDKALQVYLEEEALEDAAAIYNNMAAIYSEDKVFDKAEAYYGKALAVYRRLRNGQFEARVLCNIGALKMRQEQYDQASHLIERALFLMKAEGDKIGEVNAYSMLGDLYSRKKDYHQAVFLYQQAEELAETQGMKDFRVKNLLSLYSTYKNMAMWQDALITFEGYTKLKDQLMLENPEFQKGALSMEMEQRIADRDYLIYRAKVKEYFFWGIIGLVSILAIFGFWLSSIRRKRLANQKEVDGLRKQLMMQKVNPIFVFNVLNSLRTSVSEKNTETALTQLDNISALIRKMLEYSCEELIPLSKEIEYCKSFVAVQEQQLRKTIHFRVESNMPHDMEEIMVPSMMTQPFLEHALMQGEHLDGEAGAELNLAFVRRGNVLDVIIEDNSLGIGNYTNIELEERHRTMGLAVSMEQLKSRKSNRNGVNGFGRFKTEERFDGEKKEGHRVRFSLPLMTN